jgi:hypothetical protein
MRTIGGLQSRGMVKNVCSKVAVHVAWLAVAAHKETTSKRRLERK